MFRGKKLELKNNDCFPLFEQVTASSAYFLMMFLFYSNIPAIIISDHQRR
jgi:hypothetical protein